MGYFIVLDGKNMALVLDMLHTVQYSISQFCGDEYITPSHLHGPCFSHVLFRFALVFRTHENRILILNIHHHSEPRTFRRISRHHA